MKLCVVSEQVVPVPIVQVMVVSTAFFLSVITPDPAPNPAVPAFTLRLRIVPAVATGMLRSSVVSVQAIIEAPPKKRNSVAVEVAVPEQTALIVAGLVRERFPAPSLVTMP